MNVLILSTQSGDWEGIYVDGKLIDESHLLGGGNSRMYLLELSEVLGFTSKDIKFKELSDEDEAEVIKSGSLEGNLYDFHSKY